MGEGSCSEDVLFQLLVKAWRSCFAGSYARLTILAGSDQKYCGLSGDS
jgi:hypothetical protein